MVLLVAGAAARAPLQLPASAFSQQLAYRSSPTSIFLDRMTAYTFSNSPLEGYDLSKVIPAIVRSGQEILHPGTRIEDVHPQSDDYDWRRSVGPRALRVACRGAQLMWNRGSDRWELVFPGLKLPLDGMRDAAPFDELLLAAYTPNGVYVFQHDLQSGVRAAREASGRHVIQFVGPRCETRWSMAFSAICGKMARGCTPTETILHDDPRIEAAVAATPRELTAAAYVGVPLAACSPLTRTELLVSLVQRLDQGWLHPNARFEEAVPPWDGSSEQPELPKLDFDWRRDERRLACKVAQLVWDKTGKFWKLQFSGVKLPLEGVRDAAPFDELLLAAYTPRGVHVFRHDLQAGVSTNGKQTADKGHRIRFYGPRGMADWREAAEAVLAKMEAACEPLAFVAFDEGEGEGEEPEAERAGRAV